VLILSFVNGYVEFQGSRCWDSPDKCDLSTEHRARLVRVFRSGWDARSDAARSPDDCSRCPYWKRAQPWAHLLFADEFMAVFPQEYFQSSGPLGALNKATPFQVRQFVREAGLEIV